MTMRLGMKQQLERALEGVGTLRDLGSEADRGGVLVASVGFVDAAPAEPTGLRTTHRSVSGTQPVYGPAQINTPEFKNWFGDSKVLWEGLPLVVYHGTRGEFSAFDEAFIGQNFKDKAGIYFTNNVSHDVVNSDGGKVRVFEDGTSAGEYAKYAKGSGGPSVVPVYVKLLNPLIIDRDLDGGGVLSAIETRSQPAGTFMSEEVVWGGYDGVIVIDRDIEFPNGQPEILVVALRPDQMKSAIGNCGSFDSLNSDLRG